MSAAVGARKAPQSEGGGLSPSKLMGECRASGSGGNWEPEAIEQWRWVLRNGEGKERLLVWIKLNSIGHKSPSCVDEHGRPLRIESAAADLGWAVKTAQNACTALVAEGRIRTNKGRIYYRADVPETASASAAPAFEQSDFDFVQGNFPGYVVDFYKKQRPEKQALMAAQMRRLVAWRGEVMKEGVAELRAQIARVEITTFQSWGAPKIVLAKKDSPVRQWAQISLLADPDFVQSPGTKTVSVAPYSASNGSVQSGASLLTSDSDADYKYSPSPSAASGGKEEVVLVASRIEGLSVKTAETLLKKCRTIEPTLTALEVVHLALRKIQASPGARSPIGLLVQTLADDAAGPTLLGARLAAKRELERISRDQSRANRDDQDREYAKLVLADPQASEHEKADARALLGETQAQAAGGASS